MITMVISGHETELFAVANMAVLRKKKVNGQWKSASTNESWELFWCELTDLHPERDTVELANTEEEHEIQEDGRGEFIQISQVHSSIIGRGEYETRFRPFWDESTGSPP